MKALYVLTGSCPQTNAEVRLEYADILEEGGDPAMAEEHRALEARMRADFEDPREHVKYKLGLRKVEPMDPDEIGTSFGVTFWHEPRYSPTVVCPVWPLCKVPVRPADRSGPDLRCAALSVLPDGGSGGHRPVRLPRPDSADSCHDGCQRRRAKRGLSVSGTAYRIRTQPRTSPRIHVD